ncbi:MAG TPA: DUF4286 family protein [Gemmatimonadaceae bacterium]
MILYSVVAEVPDDLAGDYEPYMVDRHIPDLMLTGLLAGASFLRGDENRYRVDYRFQSRDEYDRYIAEHAPRLREHFNEHFNGRVKTSRTVWETVRDF